MLETSGIARDRQRSIVQTTPAGEGEYQADVNGAITIADRYRSGESHSREHTNGNDSAEDGGRLTAPQDSHADADTQQATRRTDAS